MIGERKGVKRGLIIRLPGKERDIQDLWSLADRSRETIEAERKRKREKEERESNEIVFGGKWMNKRKQLNLLAAQILICWRKHLVKFRKCPYRVGWLRQRILFGGWDGHGISVRRLFCPLVNYFLSILIDTPLF